MKIEKILRLKNEINTKKNAYEAAKRQAGNAGRERILTPTERIHHEVRQAMPPELMVLEALQDTLNFLLSPPQGEEYNAPPPLIPRKKKKRKKPQQHL